MSDRRLQVLRVASTSDPARVAGAAVKYRAEGCDVELVAVGVGAVNQAVKAAIRTRVIAAQHGENVSVIPGFRDENVDGDVLSAVVFFLRFER